MVTAIILSGGIGTRMGTECPKQYIEIEGKPILWYCLLTFEQHPLIDRIFIVATSVWQDYIGEIVRDLEMKKFSGFADAGKSRQQSIYYGLLKVEEAGEDDDIIIIHDAVRPCVSSKLLSDCIYMIKDADGAMPVLPVKDTVYRSLDGIYITNLLNRF